MKIEVPVVGASTDLDSMVVATHYQGRDLEALSVHTREPIPLAFGCATDAQVAHLQTSIEICQLDATSCLVEKNVSEKLTRALAAAGRG